MKADLPALGKVSPDLFEEVIRPRLGRRRPDVIVGPQNGVDVGVADLGGGRVMVATTDPIFVVPPYGWERSAWFAVNILASDAWTSAIPPAWITFDLNLPLSITRDDFETLWTAMAEECDRLGMAVLTGHTGRYEGCEYPMIGGATVLGVGSADAYVTPTMARPGDRVVVTKGAAIEAAGLFAVTFRDRLAAAFGEAFAREAEGIFHQMSVVDDARIASSVGVRDEGVTAMHDATECGVWGGLVEVAQASGVGLRVEKERVLLQEPVRRICEHFHVDPYAAISEGTLIATVRPHKAEAVVDRLGEEGIPATIVGDVLEPGAGIHVVEDGRERPLEHPRVDPFWAAFGRAASEAP